MTSPTLTLLVQAGTAVEAFAAMKLGARALIEELQALKKETETAGGSPAGLATVNGKLKELSQQITGNTKLLQQLGEKQEVTTAKTLKALTDEEKALKERARVEIEEAKRVARAKKQAEQDALGAKANFGSLSTVGGLKLSTPDLRQGSTETVRLQAEDIAKHLAAEKRRAAETIEAQKRAQTAQRRQTDTHLAEERVTQQRAEITKRRQTDTHFAEERVTQQRAEITKRRQTDTYLAEETAAQKQAQTAQRRQTETHLAEERVTQQRAQIAQRRQTETHFAEERATLAARNSQRREAQTSQSEATGTGRSVLRGATAAGGATFLTYGQNIPALVGTFALAAAIKASITAGVEFEYQMKFIQGITGETDAAIGRAAEAFKNLAKESVFSATQVASGGRMLAQAGFSINDSIGAMPTLLKLATVGELEMGSAAEIVAGNMHAFNLSVKDVPAIANSIAKAAAISQTNIGEMGQALRQASTVADQFGVKVNEMNALLAVLAERNIRGGSAGTALANMFRELDPATQKGSRALQVLGVQVIDPVSNRMKSMTVLISDFAKAFNKFDPASQARLAQDYLNNRAAKGLVNAIGEGGAKFSAYLKQIEEASVKTDFLDQVMGKLSQTAKVQLKEAFNTLQVTMINAFESVAPKVLEIAKSLKYLAGSEGLKDALTSVVSGFVGVIKFLTDWKSAIINVAEGYLVLKAAMLAWALATGETLVAITAVRVAMLAMLAPLAPILVGVAALAAASALWGQKTQTAAEQAQSRFGEATKEMIKDAALLAAALEAGGTAAQRMAADVQSASIEARRAVALQNYETKQALMVNLEQSKPAAMEGRSTTMPYRRKALTAATREAQEAYDQLAAINKQRDALESGAAAYDARKRQEKSAAAAAAAAADEAGGKKYYSHLKAATGEEALKKAEANAIESALKIKLAREEQGAKQSMALLDMQLKYKVISEETYAKLVDDIQDKRVRKEAEATAADIKALQAKIKTMKAQTAAQIAAQTDLNKLLALQETHASDARHKTELAAVKAKLELGAVYQRIETEREGIRGGVNKTVEEQQLARAKARQSIENQMLSGGDAEAANARLATEVAFLTEKVKLETDILKITQADKRSDEDVKRLQMLRDEVVGLKEKQSIQSHLNEEAARSDYNRQREFSFGWETAFNKYRDDATNAAQIARDMFQVSTGSMTTMLVDFAKTGKLNFRSFATSVVNEMLRIQAAQAATKILGGLAGLVGKLFPRPGAAATTPGGTPLVGDFPGGSYFTAHTGGIVGALTASKFANPLAFAGASRFHTGGLVGGEVPIIAKKGEGVFTEGQMRAMAPVAKGGGDTFVISVTVNAETGESKTDESKTDGGAGRAALLGNLIGAKVREVIVKEQRNGGLLSKV